ncbi:MAG: GNAT family N-acetyltransferase [Actinomycetia bacterium]|nr:GNAT family N-acetyltransferase [Actinomycetes bacterium]
MHNVVRSPSEDDADAMGAVHVRAWRAAYSGGLMPDEYLDSLSAQARANMWRQQLAQPVADRSARFVVENPAGVVVGFALIGPKGNDSDADDGELYVINVDPESWGTGAGPVLHEEAVDALRDSEFGRAVLWVHPKNHRARHFYESRGWRADDVDRVETVLGVEIVEVRYSLILY